MKGGDMEMRMFYNDDGKFAEKNRQSIYIKMDFSPRGGLYIFYERKHIFKTPPTLPGSTPI